MSAKHAETIVESGTEVFIPLNKLRKSPKNARKTPHSEAAIEAYAASIAAKGILQNLVVEPELDGDGAATGFYSVTIGEGRRLAQLLRVKRKEIKKTEPIRCIVDTANDPHEISLDENFVQIVVLLFAWIVVLLAFFILAIQLFVTLIEFKLTTLAGYVLIPFGLFGKTAFAAERVLGNVISSGVKVLVLAVIVGIGSTLFAQFTAGFGGNQPTIEDAMSMVLAALSLLGLGIFGPGIANGIVSGGPQLGAGAAVGTGLAAGGIVAAGVAGAGMGAGAAGGALAGAARGGASVAAAASAAYRGGGGAAQPGSSAIASPLRRAAASNVGEAGSAATSDSAPSTGSPPAWARRMKRSQTVSHAASAASHAVRSGDPGGGGASVDLSQGER